MSNEVERFAEHPDPDRFASKIGQADVETRVMDRDDVTFRTQLVPGGSFGFELSTKFSYASYDCSQHISLDREAAESLYERLGEVLEADPRE